MAVVVVLGLIGQIIRYTTGHAWVYGFVPKTNLNGEANIPAYFSSIILLAASALLAVIGVTHKTSGAVYWRHWVGLALIFLWLSLDEAAALHELATEPLQAALGTRGIFFYAWVIPALGLLAVFAVSFWRFYFHLPLDTRRRFTIAAVLYLGGGLGIEFIEAALADARGEGDFIYVLLVAAEEMIEMAGVIVFIDALLRYIIEHRPRVGLMFSQD